MTDFVGGPPETGSSGLLGLTRNWRLGNRTLMAVWRDGTTAALTDNAVGMMDNAVAQMPTAATATPALRYGRMTGGEV